MRSGRIYLLLLLGTSLVLFLPAILATWVLAGTLDFTPGGILAGKASAAFVAATARALRLRHRQGGIDPRCISGCLRRWSRQRPSARCCTPLRWSRRAFSPCSRWSSMCSGSIPSSRAGANEWLIFVASASLLTASLIALSRDNLKARLAYSTVSQLAYVVLGAALATTTSIVGSGLQIAMHAAGKITLFFCAGAIYTAHHLTEVSQMTGIGRKMPITMLAFLVGALSIIGLPPFGGAWSKWTLALGALDAGYGIVVGVLMLSSLLSAGYLLPIVARGFFLPAAAGRRCVDYSGGTDGLPDRTLVARHFSASSCSLSRGESKRCSQDSRTASAMADEHDPHEKAYWLDDPRNVDRLVHGFYVVCGMLLAIDVFVPKHGLSRSSMSTASTASSDLSLAWHWC